MPHSVQLSAALRTVACAHLPRRALDESRHTHGAVEASTDRLVLNDDLRRAERHAIVSRLSSVFAHLIGTPLNVIAGRAALIKSNPEGAAVLENATRIEQQVERLAFRIRKLIDYWTSVDVDRGLLPAATIVRDDPKPVRRQVEHLRFPTRSIQRPPVAEQNGRPEAPIFEKDVRPVRGGHAPHRFPPLVHDDWLGGQSIVVGSGCDVHPARRVVAFGAELQLVGEVVMVVALVLRVGDRKHLRVVSAGSGFLSSNDPREHFGLGAATKAEELEVTWPDGRVERFPDLAADRLYTLEDSGGSKPSRLVASDL